MHPYKNQSEQNITDHVGQGRSFLHAWMSPQHQFSGQLLFTFSSRQLAFLRTDQPLSPVKVFGLVLMILWLTLYINLFLPVASWSLRIRKQHQSFQLYIIKFFLDKECVNCQIGAAFMDSSHLSIGASVSKLLRSLNVDWKKVLEPYILYFISYEGYQIKVKKLFFIIISKPPLLQNRRMGGTGVDGDGFRIFEHIFR